MSEEEKRPAVSCHSYFCESSAIQNSAKNKTAKALKTPMRTMEGIAERGKVTKNGRE